MAELVERRTANSKTFLLPDGKRQAVFSIGDVHFKDNYADPGEAWKDIDLTWVGNQILTAPYKLTLAGSKITVKDKKTGEISTIERLSVSPASIPFEIVPEYTRVSFRHILPSASIPFEASFRITGNIPLITRAFDDAGELVLETTIVGDILTEKFTGVKDKRTGLVRAAVGSIRIDPTWQVGASTDDCFRQLTASYWSLTWTSQIGGGADTTVYQRGGGMRFLNITIPNATNIDSAYLTLRCRAATSGTTVNTIISAEDVDDAVTFANDAAAFDTRWAARTTAEVNWDAIGAWTLDADYNSPEIKTVIQEIVDRVGWASGQDIVIFWEDYGDRSSHLDGCQRSAYSYDGSAEFAPKLVVTYSVPTVVTPGTLALALTLYAPTIVLGTVVTPGTLALTLTFYAPTILLTEMVFPKDKFKVSSYGITDLHKTSDYGVKDLHKVSIYTKVE